MSFDVSNGIGEILWNASNVVFDTDKGLYEDPTKGYAVIGPDWNSVENYGPYRDLLSAQGITPPAIHPAGAVNTTPNPVVPTANGATFTPAGQATVTGSTSTTGTGTGTTTSGSTGNASTSPTSFNLGSFDIGSFLTDDSIVNGVKNWWLLGGAIATLAFMGGRR